MKQDSRTSRFVGAALATLVLAGCQSGTLVGEEQTCRSVSGLLEKEEIRCSGSVEKMRGSLQLSIVEVEDELDGPYRLGAEMTVGRGTVRAHVTGTDGKRVGGEIVPSEPRNITALVEPEKDKDIEATVEVAGREATNLTYTSALVPQE